MAGADKAAEMAGTAVRGGYNLFWGLSISTVISAVGVIVLARLLSPSDYGLVTIALVGPTLISSFRDWGINSAMIKYIAQYRAEGKPEALKAVLVSGFIFELIAGAVLSAVSFLLAGYLAVELFHNSALSPLISVASLYVFANAVATAAQASFVGYERMELNSYMQIFLSIVKAFLAPLLVLLGFGVFGAVLGNAVSFLFAGLFGAVILYLAVRRSLRYDGGERLSVGDCIRMMFVYGLPLTAAGIIGGFLGQFYAFLAAVYVTSTSFGNYQVAVNFSVLITFFSAPISTVLFPAFSKLRAQEESAMLKRGFRLSVKFAAFLVVPTAAAFMALSGPAISTIFGSKYETAPLYLGLLAITYLLTAFGSLSVGNLFTGQGRTDLFLKVSIPGWVAGLLLSLVLIPLYGIVGLILTLVFANVPGTILGLFWAREYFGASIEWGSSARILAASAFAGVVTFLVVSQLALESWVLLIIGAAIFLSLYIVSAPLLGAISRSDVQSLRAIMRSLGPLAVIVNPVLGVVDRLARK